jgi:uncharacterized protein involved in exopolysaccharide biosynthesis
MTSQSVYYEDEIDIREIFNSLLRYKWWILGTAVIFAVVALLVAKLILPKTYEATSFIMFTKPALTADLDSSIQSSPQIPDARSLTDLTKADDLVLSVYEEIRPANSGSEPVTLVSFKDQLNPTLVGINQLKLKVTDLDPDRAALIANVWAVKASARLNLLFGSDVDSLLKLEEQTEEARQKWDRSENALIEYLPTSQADTLQVNITQARETLKIIISKIENIDLLLSDLNALQYRLDAQDANEVLTLDEILSMISLQQQAVGQFEGLQIQVSSPDIQAGAYTIRQARANVETLIESLQQQREELLSNKQVKEAEITELGTQLEEAQYNIAQLSVQRNLDLKAYEALSSHMEELSITLYQNDKSVKVAGLALPPTDPSGPRALFVAAAAGAVGFALAAFLVLFFSWWKSTNHAE